MLKLESQDLCDPNPDAMQEAHYHLHPKQHRLSPCHPPGSSQQLEPAYPGDMCETFVKHCETMWNIGKATEKSTSWTLDIIGLSRLSTLAY